MNTVRNNITRIKNSILLKLPDGEDIFGFKGINKKAIEDLLSDSYNYSYQLNELEPKVEIVLLKRKLAAILDPLREKIDSIDFAKDDGDGFNDILNGIVAIRDAIRSTYIYVVDKGLRTEVYAIDLKTKVDGTEKNVSHLMKLAETVEQSLAGFQKQATH
jgi:DNA-binding FrmR family transcriptional regulator